MIAWIFLFIDVLAALLLAHKYTKEASADFSRKVSMAAIAPVALFGLMLMPLHIYGGRPFIELLVEQVIILFVGIAVSLVCVSLVCKVKDC